MVSNTATQRTDIGHVLKVKAEKKLQCVPQQIVFFKIVRAELQCKNFIYADTDHKFHSWKVLNAISYNNGQIFRVLVVQFATSVWV